MLDIDILARSISAGTVVFLLLRNHGPEKFTHVKRASRSSAILRSSDHQH